MKTLSLKSKIVPVTTILICIALWKMPSGLGVLEVMVTAIVILAASLMEFKKPAFQYLGFKKSNFSFKSLFIIAPLLACLMFLLYYFVLIPGVTSVTNAPIDFSGLSDIQGNLVYALIALVFIWISAGFGEEIIWRGYFMGQFSKFFGDSTKAKILNVLVISIFFGLMHSYQGVTGQIVTGIISLILSSIFLIRKQDLWFNIAVHAFFDTIGLIMLYNGWM